jgi:hypothetical protein
MYPGYFGFYLFYITNSTEKRAALCFYLNLEELRRLLWVEFKRKHAILLLKHTFFCKGWGGNPQIKNFFLNS